MHGGNVLQQIGLEQYYYIKNQSGLTIENGRVVRAAGTLGSSGRILGEYMISDGSIEGKYALGIATENIIDGDDGYITEFGLVRGINTTGSLYGETWFDGDILYVSPTIAGGLTKVRPIAPDLHIQMAIVVYANANGSLFVRPDRFPSLGDLQSVYLNGATNGDLLTLSGGTWTASKTLNGSYTITGSTDIGGGLTADTVSASTYYGDGSNLTGISTQDTFVTGGTYNTGTAVFTNNIGGTFNVTGFSDGEFLSLSGGTVSGETTFNNNLTVTSQINAGIVSTPISFQTNDASETYTIDMSASNIILFSAGTATACTLSYSGAVVGQYTLIVDNTSLRSLTFATSSGWFSNLGIQPNLTGQVFISATYDGSRMFITELESMNEI
jgi:hypothetical protein